MGMGTRLYPLPGGDGDGTKGWYLLGLGMGMRMNFFYGNGYGISKPVPPRPIAIPSLNIVISLLITGQTVSFKVIYDWHTFP